MKISVVTPSFNQGRFIQNCIDSIKAQHGVQVEHIIFDNCSTDETAVILEKHQKNPGSVDLKIFIEKDSGQTNAINKGFKIATGDVVCWLNTDEYYTPNALVRVAKFFRDHPDTDVLYGDCDFVDVEGRLIKRKREFGFSKAMLLYYGCYIPSCATFIRRRVIAAEHLLDESYRVAMDLEYYNRLTQLGWRFSHFPACLASFTWHETNISSTQFARRLIEKRKIQDHYSRIPRPVFFQTLIYEVLWYFWAFIRILRRRIFQAISYNEH